METDWKTKELDAAYLLESGILFEINRSLCHQLGFAIVVKKDENGKIVLGFKDSRENPEDVLFSKEVYAKGHHKLRKFMRDFGYGQLKKRDKALGWSSQSWHIPEGRRYTRKAD